MATLCERKAAREARKLIAERLYNNHFAGGWERVVVSPVDRRLICVFLSLSFSLSQRYSSDSEFARAMLAAKGRMSNRTRSTCVYKRANPLIDNNKRMLRKDNSVFLCAINVFRAGTVYTAYGER